MIRTPAVLLLAAALLVPGPAQAQSMLGQSRPGGAQGTQGGPAPVPSTAPLAPVQVLPLPAVTAPGAGQQAQPMPAPAPQPPPAPIQPPTTQPPAAPQLAAPQSATPPVPIPGEWVAQGTAELRGIDKVTARTAPLTAKVGETLRFGPLTVTVRGCAIRPSDLPQDATAFLEVAETGQAPLFRGWMLLSQPQLGLVEHPTHDIRLYACRP